MGKSNLKKVLVAFFIISLVCLVAFFGLNSTYFLLASGNDFQALGDSYLLSFNMLLGSIVYPFGLPASDGFAQYCTDNGLNPLIFSIVNIVLAAILFVLLVVGLIRVFVKRKGAFAIYALAWLAMAFIALAGVAHDSHFMFFVAKDLFANPAPDKLLLIILAFVTLVFAILSVIFVFITYFVGLSYAGKKQELGNVEAAFETQQPVLAEENLAPEEQESEEAVAEVVPEYVPVLEPEPEEEAGEEEVPEAEPEPEEEPLEVQEEPEPEDFVEPEPIPEPQPDETNNHLEVNVNNNPAPAQPAGIDPNSLAALLREVVRDIVRDEIARNNVNQPRVNEDSKNGGNQTITGATFGGPLVVQYFNGGINGVTPAQAPVATEEAKPAPAPAPVEEAKPAPVEEVKPEPEPVKEEPQPAPAPAPEVVVPVAAPAEEGEKQVYERLSFGERLLQSDQEILDLYNELKNEILSYGVKSRVSANGDTFRLHKKMYVRITVAGKSLKLYFALNPDDYKDSKIPVQDAGHKDLYAEIPLVFKVRSGLSVRRCKELIQDVMEKDGLEQGEVGKINWAKELKAELKEKAKSKKDDED